MRWAPIICIEITCPDDGDDALSLIFLDFCSGTLSIRDYQRDQNGIEKKEQNQNEGEEEEEENVKKEKPLSL